MLIYLIDLPIFVKFKSFNDNGLLKVLEGSIFFLILLLLLY